MRQWLLSIALLICACAGLGVAEPAQQGTATRVLHFPKDQCVGKLGVKTDANAPDMFGQDMERWASGYPHYAFLAMAQGDVLVPGDRPIELGVSIALRAEDRSRVSALDAALLEQDWSKAKARADDLSWLAGLGPNDLHGLGVWASAPVKDAESRVLEPIARLTGLQTLRLNAAVITSEGLKHLKGLRRLKALGLSGQSPDSMIANASLAAIKDLSSLEFLDLDLQVTDVGLKHLSQLPRLRWLRLRTGTFYGPGLAHLAELPQLERLCLWGETGLTDRHVHYLEGLGRLKGLTLWGGGPLTDASLASIGKMTGLEDVTFIRVQAQFTDRGAAYLTGLKALKGVAFFCFKIGERGVRELAGLPALERIKGVRLTNEGLAVLGQMVQLKSLDINLVPPPSGGSADPDLDRLADLKSLEELFLNGWQIRDHHLALLKDLPRLKHLHISGQGLTNAGMVWVSQARHLEDFRLCGNVTASGLNPLNGVAGLRRLQFYAYPQHDNAPQPDPKALDLSGLANLRYLSLSGLALEEKDMKCMESLHKLEHLSLSGCPPEGSLRHIKGLANLEYLDVSCQSGDALACLSDLHRLAGLTLRGEVTDAALRTMPALPSLRHLTIQTNESIQADTIAYLKQILPTVEYGTIETIPELHRAGPARTR